MGGADEICLCVCVCGDSSSSSSTAQGVIGQMRGNKKFKLTKKLGSGSFGDIYLGVHVQSAEEVAVKLEPVRTPHPQLLYEAKGIISTNILYHLFIHIMVGVYACVYV